MSANSDYIKKASLLFHREEIIEHKEIHNSFLNRARDGMIRFEEKKEKWIWLHPGDICFVKSADHYVKTLVNSGSEKKWLIRHCTLKELLTMLPGGTFIRLNKFYLLNHHHFSHIDEKAKLLYFNDNSFIPVPHRISPYILDLLNTIREIYFTKNAW